MHMTGLSTGRDMKRKPKKVAVKNVNETEDK